MSKLTIDPIKPYLFGFTNVVIAVVGAGGTGGYLLQSLARLLVHLGRPDGIRVVVFDGDHVEEKNVGRQLFSHAEIGRNKAETLVRRFNLAFGLHMIAIPEMADEQLLRDVCRAQQRGWVARYATLLCGCVDTTAAREQIDQAWARLANHGVWQRFDQPRATEHNVRCSLSRYARRWRSSWGDCTIKDHVIQGHRTAVSIAFIAA